MIAVSLTSAMKQYINTHMRKAKIARDTKETQVKLELTRYGFASLPMNGAIPDSLEPLAKPYAFLKTR